jgi:hypothetical protein
LTDFWRLFFSNYRFRVIKSKAFLVSQALADGNIDTAASGLGLEEFKRLLGQKKKENPNDLSGNNPSFIENAPG